MSPRQPALPCLTVQLERQVALDILAEISTRIDHCIAIAHSHPSFAIDARVSLDRAANAAAHNAWLSAAHLVADAAGIEIDIVPAPPRPSHCRPPMPVAFESGIYPCRAKGAR